MADAFQVSMDVSGFLSFFDKLGEKAVSLGSRMAVSGGRELRDEAIINAPQSSPPYNPYSRGSQQPGTLADAMYLARNERLTTSTTITYSVSWNRQKAWWGHLAEFGWWQTHKIEYIEGYDFFITTDEELPTPIRHSGSKFLSKSFDAALPRAKEAMLERGRMELPNLLRESQ